MKTKYIAVNLNFKLVSKASNLNKLVEDINSKNKIDYFSKKFKNNKHLIYVNKNEEILHIYKL